MTNTILSILFILCLSGCSVFRPDNQTLKITCQQPGVVLKVNGDRFPCPATVDVRRDSKVILEATKEGYDPYTKLVDYHLSTAGKWDVAGTLAWFFPVLGLVNPGAWDLDQTIFEVKLYEAGK